MNTCRGRCGASSLLNSERTYGGVEIGNQMGHSAGPTGRSFKRNWGVLPYSAFREQVDELLKKTQGR